MDAIRQLLEISADYTIYREKRAQNPDLISEEEARLELDRLAADYATALILATKGPVEMPSTQSEQDRISKELHGLAYVELGDEEKSAVDMEVANPGSFLSARNELKR